MEYQPMINGLCVIAIICMLCAMFCFVGVGILTHKRDKAFEKTQIEFKEKMKL